MDNDDNKNNKARHEQKTNTKYAFRHDEEFRHKQADRQKLDPLAR